MPSMATFVILEKIRETISFLRKSSVSSELVSVKSIILYLKYLVALTRSHDLGGLLSIQLLHLI